MHFACRLMLISFLRRPFTREHKRCLSYTTNTILIYKEANNKLLVNDISKIVTART